LLEGLLEEKTGRKADSTSPTEFPEKGTTVREAMATKADCDRIVERIQQLIDMIPESIAPAGNPLDGRAGPP